MVQSLENIDKSKVYAGRIAGLDEVVEGIINDTLTGAVSTITTTDLTANKILISNANGKVSASDKGINDIPTDSDLVHKTGTETIAGAKTFTNNMITGNINLKGDITLGTSSNTWGKMVHFQDTTGKRIARIQPMAIDTTNNRVGMWVNNANNSVEKGIYIDSDGTTSAPTPSTDDNSTNIATTAFVKAQGYAVDSGLVHKTGNETITGVKTFTEDPIIQRNMPDVIFKIANVTKGTAPSASSYSGLQLKDEDGNNLGHIRGAYYTNKEVSVYLSAYKANASSDTQAALLAVNYPASGDSYATAPSSDRNGSIVTTTGINKSPNGYVKFGNGLIIQWLYFAVSNNYVTVTFPTSFSNTNYAIVQTPISNNGTFPGGAWTGIRDKTMTNVKLGIRAGAGVGADTSYSHAIAIGY